MFIYSYKVSVQGNINFYECMVEGVQLLMCLTYKVYNNNIQYIYTMCVMNGGQGNSFQQAI